MAAKKRNRSPRDGMEHTDIFLWRHPETAGFQGGKFWGHTDVGLSTWGKSQQKAVAKFMTQYKLDAIFSSNLQRTHLVAQAVARAQRPRRVVTTLPELRELDLGDWEGMTYSDISKSDPEGLKERMDNLAGFRIPGGESLEMLKERVIPVFQKLVDDNFGGRICIVGHAGVNRVILCTLLGAPLDRLFRLEQDFACMNRIQVFEDGVPVIKKINFTLNIKM